MTLRKVPFRFVEVLWEDAVSQNDTWVDLKKENLDTELVFTRGWLVKEKESYIAVASSVSAEELEEETVGNVMSIPRGMVRHIRELRVQPVKEKKKPE